ncbi:MAG: sulfurtransferase [Uliginosibacterium sp.]|nr:sulfurtransferase [Uliginosibacterium sp.]
MPHTLLIAPAELAAHFDKPDWFVFDVRHELQDTEAGRTAYRAGHIPGAIFLHMDEDLSAGKTGKNGRHPLPDRDAFAARLAALGVAPGTQVVAYDAAGGMMAARLWWMLRWLGHEKVAVLDGGWPAWATHYPISTDTPPARPAGTLQAHVPLTRQVSAAEVLTNINKKEKLVLDARGPDRFRGENETMDPVGGHIPGARNRCFRDNLGPDGCFKDAATLRQEFLATLGDFAPTQVISQCGSGVTACHNLLAMEQAGLPGAALYPGSWSEWCSDPARPVAR